MSATDKLKGLMTLSPEIETFEIEERFGQIARLLFEKFAIRKGNEIYLFKDIEFYFYNRNHKDIITHPRNSHALCWYVNNFGGIDLNLPSYIEESCKSDSKGKITKKYSLDDNSYFGGILIKQLIDKASGRLLVGPLACAEIFRCHNALGYDEDFPTLIEYDNVPVAFKRFKRHNLISNRQKIEEKVDNILRENYHEHNDAEELYTSFRTFKEKLYGYFRFENLMHDEKTNEVYLSPILNDAKDGHPAFYSRLTSLLKEIGIQYKELQNTNDYWVRDFMPVQLGTREFLKYKYYPDYLVSNDEDNNSISDVDKVMRGMGFSCRKTSLTIDGGNMVACGPYIVMTDKVFTENKRQKGDVDFKRELETELGHPVIIIPWVMHGNPDDDNTDKYGHSDGFVKWCGDNRILMGNHGDSYPEEAAEIKRILESYGFKVTEIRFSDKVANPCDDLNWAYINFLQVGKDILMPIFNLEEDDVAYQYITTAFPGCRIHKIDSTEIAHDGGCLHCISWNILAPNTLDI